MSKLFIPTVSQGVAHEADVFGVDVVSPFTATCSGDGSIKLWKNKLLDGEQPKDHCLKQFVDASGLHHIDVFHSIERNGEPLSIVACVAFTGKIYMYRCDLENWTLQPLEIIPQEENRSFWCVRWFKSGDHKTGHKFAATNVNGETHVWNFNVFEDDDDTQFSISLNLLGIIKPPQAKFATSIDLSQNGLLAVGFSDGTVIISQIGTLRPLYTFEGFGLQGTEENSNTVRSLKFSPLGTLLAVANDSGSYGCVTLYETEFGEPVGTLSVPSHSSQKSIVSVAHNGWVFDMSFSTAGEHLATCGYDGCVRIWDVKFKEHVSTLHMSKDEIQYNDDQKQIQKSQLAHPPVLGVRFIAKGIRGGMSADINEGLVCVCLDRSIRWYREAGGA